ncbi:MAG: monovalent cation/H+ antiporter subunit D family protein [Puniceicoccaceae bacterium]
MITEHLPVLLPVSYLVAAFLIPLANLFHKRSAYGIAVVTALLMAVLSIYGFIHVVSHGTIHYSFGGWEAQIGIPYVWDILAAFFSAVVNIVAAVVLLHSWTPVQHELSGRSMTYYAVILVLLAGFNGIIITGDLFNLFVFIEISSLSMYGLIASGGRKAPFAAFRYLILGTIGASLILLGVGYLYFVTGTLNMQDMQQLEPLVRENPAVRVGMLLITVGILIKMAIFPMHGWMPDSYSQAPSTSSALLAGLGTKVSAYILIRVLLFVFGVDFITGQIPVGACIAVLSAIGIIFGSVMAIAQNDLKRMLAYSSAGQIGYIGLGIGLANPLCFIGAVLHVINHAFMKVCLFLVAANLKATVGHTDIRKFNARYKRQFPLTMAAFTIAALSMIGLPPFAGFFSKWYLVLVIVESKLWVYAGVIVVSSLLNAVYFFRILEKVYLRSPDAADDAAETDESTTEPHEAELRMTLPTMVLAIAIVALGIFNVWIVSALEQVIPNLF